MLIALLLMFGSLIPVIVKMAVAMVCGDLGNGRDHRTGPL